MSWLNFNLVPYIARVRILPDTQVATQQGVQTRDLMSALASVKCWAKRRKTTVYGCVRDQMKGFDYLSPQGMYDATDTLIITPGRQNDPHLLSDTLSVRLNMVEATDDSHIFALTADRLRQNVLAMEHFQFAYGWLTQWKKSYAYILEPSTPPPDSLDLHSISVGAGIDPLSISVVTVPLLANDLSFLRAKIDDPGARVVELKSFIDDFTFPRFIVRPPITLIRKITKQNIISRIRALLSLQPIKQADADDLDSRIKMKIHAATGMPFAPNTDVLTLPLQYHGLDFPSLAALSTLPRSSLHPPNLSSWASDGSMLPAAAGILDPKSVTSALTGPATLVLKIEGHNVSILQGELVGLIMALILSPADDATSVLYTDHLNSVRLIDDSRTVVDQYHRLRTMNARSYYRWILALVARNPLKIIYTRAHTDDVSLPSLLNFEADHYASSAQHVIDDVFTSPTPTFFMDDFSFHTHIDGWIESNICSFFDKTSARAASITAGIAHQRMSLRLHDDKPPPEWSYTHAYSAYSAVVQLYARSGQLPTADLLHTRGKRDSPNCRLGCDDIEDMHHIFVTCSTYADWRSIAAAELVPRTRAKLANLDIEEVIATDLLAAAKSLFVDDERVWPLQYSVYFLGHIPSIEPLIPDAPHLNPLSRSRLAYSLAADWHTAAIRLAGRIWGDWQRRMSLKTHTRRRLKI
ncbi:hypothetical protein C8R46DRAFT_900122 [Mycena filopes]|nr:hypothetical protein C8R46DRAFT_900122 [Mycena filopes]